MNNRLQSYLNDHLGGATAAVAVLERLAASSSTAGDRRFFLGLQEEVDADKAVVVGLLEGLGGSRSAMREAGGWMSEKLMALKARFDDPGGGLHEFEALEALALGIHGKRALWRVLRAVSQDVPGLAGLDYDSLEARARDQHDRVDARRITAASEALRDR